MKFNSTFTRQFSTELQLAINEVCNRHNITPPTLDVRRYRGDGGCALMKASFYPAGGLMAVATASMAARGGEDLKRMMARDGIATDQNAKGDRLVKYNPRARKNPYEYHSAAGAQWVCSAEHARKRFGTAPGWAPPATISAGAHLRGGV